MSRIRGRNTLPELHLRRALWSRGCRYRLHYGVLGKPDIVFVSARIAVFVDGCFWHACPEHGVRPKNNREFWRKKLDRNIERDREVNRLLAKAGWKVIRVWEHEIANGLDAVVARIATKLEHQPE